MEKEELKEKVYAISNCEFPLDAFLNDTLRNTNPRFNKEMALRDIEKICDTFIEFRTKNAQLKGENNSNRILMKEWKKIIEDLRKENEELKKKVEQIENELTNLEKGKKLDWSFSNGAKFKILREDDYNELEAQKQILEILKTHASEWYDCLINNNERFSIVIKIFGEPENAKKVREWVGFENEKV